MEQPVGFRMILDKLPDHIRSALESCATICKDATEIVLRAEQPVCVYFGGKCRFVTNDGILTDEPRSPDLIRSSGSDIESTVLRLCDYSVYTYQHEIVEGYITIGKGVRAGLCGRAVLRDGAITNIRDISTLSFRVSREIIGCAEPLLRMIDPLRGVLICGAPGSGKTTLLRDIARVLSYRYRVSLIDERDELSAKVRSAASFDLGLCDIYSGYPKGKAAVSAIRSMAPGVIICDELGDEKDAEMLLYALRCGTAFIASVHASSMNDLRTRKVTATLIRTGAFRYIVFLSSGDAPGRVSSVYEMSDAAL